MTRTALHHRGDVLRAVLDQVEQHPDGMLPTDVAGTTACFHDALDLVGALQFRWHNRLAGSLEQRLAGRPDDLRAAVRDAWVDAARSLPGLRALLDAQLADPADDAVAAALLRATAKEHQLLATMAGRGGRLDQPVDPRAVRVGRAIEEAARARLAGDVALEPRRSSSGPTRVPRGSASFVRRLKAVLAA